MTGVFKRSDKANEMFNLTIRKKLRKRKIQAVVFYDMGKVATQKKYYNMNYYFSKLKFLISYTGVKIIEKYSA